MAHRPEVDLLLCCARTNLSSEEVGKIRALLYSEIDWPYLVRMAAAHGVIPLLYVNLKKTFPDSVPVPTLEHLHAQFLANAGRNLLLTEELFKLLHLLETKGIPSVPYKGPLLAGSVYGDLALRTFSDLDIVVHKRDFPRAKALLLSQGYRLDLSLTPEMEIAFLQSDFEADFIRDDGKVAVDIQWGKPKDLPYPMKFELFWERLEQASLEGRMISTFAPADLVIILSMHGASHCWERLHWVCDVAELIQVHPGIDWPGVIDRAERLGWRRFLFLGLFLAHDLLQTILPEEISEKIQGDSSVPSLAHQVREKLFREETVAIGTRERSFFYLKMIERFQDRIRYCLRMAFHPSVVDWEAFPLPRPLFFLYYLIHPLRVAGKYGWQHLKHLF